jgi:hypothetical protein
MAVALGACGGEGGDSLSGVPAVDSPEDPFDEGKTDSPIPARENLSTLDSLGSSGPSPVAEASGLALRRDPEGTELIVIGDRDHVVATASLDDEADLSSLVFDHHDVSELFPGASGSQWEAVDVDREGRLFLLEEQPGTVHVLSPDLSALLHTIELDVSDTVLSNDWEAEPNSRGEGLVLGLGGHLIVLKEKRPSLIVEFGPEDDEPLGYWRADREDGAAVDFPLPPGEFSRFVPLAIWQFRSKVRDLLTDMSELAVGPDGYLHVLSGDARVLARISDDLDPEDSSKLSIDLAWKVPKAVSNPEGLVVLRPFEFLIASDDGGSENLFHFWAKE